MKKLILRLSCIVTTLVMVFSLSLSVSAKNRLRIKWFDKKINRYLGMKESKYLFYGLIYNNNRLLLVTDFGPNADGDIYSSDVYCSKMLDENGNIINFEKLKKATDSYKKGYVGTFYDKNNRLVVLDTDGKVVHRWPKGYKICSDLIEESDNIIIKNKKSYYLSTLSGKLKKLPPVGNYEYDKSIGFTNIPEDMIKYELKGKVGFVDKNANVVTKAKYEAAGTFDDGLCIVVENGKYGIINNKGIEIIKPEYEMISDYVNGIAYFKNNDKIGFFDREGRVIIEPEYDDARIDFTDDLIGVSKDGEFGFINSKGEEKIKFQFEDVTNFENGYASAKIKGKWGLINKKGDFVILPKYEFRFYTGGTSYFAFVSINEDNIYLNKNGEKIIPKYLVKSSFSKNVAYAQMNNNKGNYILVNKKGRIIWKLPKKVDEVYGLDYVKPPKNFAHIVAAKDKYGLMTYE